MNTMAQIAPPMTSERRPVRRRKKNVGATIAFVIFVVAPTLAATVYYAVIAAPIYETEARFTIQSQESVPTDGGILGTLLAGGAGPSPTEALAIVDYVMSLDAVAALRSGIDLEALYRVPEADFWARLPDDALAEDVLYYYNNMIEIYLDPVSGITTLKTKAFRPEDAQKIAIALLDQSELVVNRFNERIQRDILHSAEQDVTVAEDNLAKAEERLTKFRRQNAAIDVSQATTASLSIIAGLQSQVAATEADIQGKLTYMKPDNPQITSLRSTLDGLRTQILQEQQRLTGQSAPVAENLTDFAQIQLEQTLANNFYSTALSSLEAARAEARRQQNYLVTIVTPDLPQKDEYPKRIEDVILVLVGSLLVFGIGTLIVAGVRDHIIQ
jgi:capsular polysaccharide transport system permease protein